MCLGSGARNANKAAMRQYKYQLAQRERNWMNTLAITSVERVQYEQTIDSTNVGLQNFYGDLQGKYGDLIGQAMQANEEAWNNYLKNSEGAKLAAAGRTGRSAERVASTELGQFFANQSRTAWLLTKGKEQLTRKGAEKAAATRAQQMQLFAQNSIIRSPDIAPPRPVLQNVGQAAFMDALSIASSVATIATGIGSAGTFMKGLGGASKAAAGGNLGLNTSQLVARDTLRYGNTFPAGSF